MSAAAEVIAELRARGARIRAEGSTLYVAPRSVLTPELSERVRALKPELVELVRSVPPELALSARGREALGGKASAPARPAPEYAAPSSPEERKALLDRFLRDERVPFATFDSPGGAFLIVRDRRALEALDQEHAALPVLYVAELERWAEELGPAGLRALLAARAVEGAGVELRRVTRTHVDG